MDDSWYSLEVSPWWVLAALILAAAVSYLLYSREKVPWGKRMNILMGFLRFSSVFLIILLLINPLIEYNKNIIEKPIVVIALDNSESIPLRQSGTPPGDIKKWIEKVTTELTPQYDVKLDLQKASKGDSLLFDANQTDLSKQLTNIKNTYADQNLAAVILATDGIINKGQSPMYSSYRYPIYSLGLGDSLAPKDITIQNVRLNKVAYQGNKYPVEIQLSQRGFEGQQVNVTINNGNQNLFEEEIILKTGISNLSALLTAEKSGSNRLSISVEEVDGESTFVNNSQNAYIDVIEGKDRILILAPAPHPDINAIRSVLSATTNYETTLYIPGIHPKPKDTKFDAIIEHQGFSNTNYGEFESSGMWYILGSNSDLRKMAQSLNYLLIKPKGSRNSQDQARGMLNDAFTKFKFSGELIDRFKNYPPIQVPFADYSVTGPTEVLLNQRIGSVTTERPMMTFFDDGSRKSAVLVGSGFWQWKLQEAASEENPKLFREIVLKTVQYLSIKTNKDRFIAKPRETDYLFGESVNIDTEVYSEIFERSYGNDIALRLTEESGSVSDFELVDSEANSSFRLGRLSPGIYRFSASTTLGGKVFEKKGSFAVRDIQIEAINLTANHNLLRTVAKNSDGQFFHFAERDALTKALKEKKFQTMIHTEDDQFPLINSLWLIVLIGMLLSSEWFLRKYLGAY